MIAPERRILLADDDAPTRESWSELLVSWGYTVKTAADGAEALEILQGFDPAIMLLDLMMPRMGGIEVLEEIRRRGLDVTTIVISGEGDIPEAVKAIKLGAYDFLPKPVDADHLSVLLANITRHRELSNENRRLRHRLMGAGELGPMVGGSLAMRRVMGLVEQVAPSSASVIITGESGTGKDLTARTIHDLSPRHSGPYIAINCAAIPETLMESEMFGHERGAFTGADRRREGSFELANGGTLLLDEITEMRTELQAKLLRVIEERKLRRLGGSQEIALDVRVLAASNRDLPSAIRDGRLREDLYYRLNVFTIDMPALRERPADVPLIVDHFIRQLAETNGKEIRGAGHECIEALKRHPWPGNVRQLRNVIERALIVSRGPLIGVADLPPEFRSAGGQGGQSFEVRLGASFDTVERELLTRTIQFAGGNKTKAAEILGISSKTLYNRLQRYEENEAGERSSR